VSASLVAENTSKTGVHLSCYCKAAVLSPKSYPWQAISQHYLEANLQQNKNSSKTEQDIYSAGSGRV